MAGKYAELDLGDSQAVLSFGSRVQDALAEVSDSMLERVRTKDADPAGETLNEMVLTLRGFEMKTAADAEPAGWLRRLLGRGRGVAELLQRYQGVRDQIDHIISRLYAHQTNLLVDIETLDRLYDANLDYVHEIEGYIEVGEVKLRALDNEAIPRLMASIDEANDVIGTQHLSDLRASREALDRRLQDLRLTRQIALQGLASLRLVQENDRSLVSKIDTTLTTTVPLWRQQLARALSIQRARDAVQTVTAANDLTNDFLRENAERLQLANQETREQVEREMFHIDAIAEANRNLIATIADSLRTVEQVRAAKERAAEALVQMEQQLNPDCGSAECYRSDQAAH